MNFRLWNYLLELLKGRRSRLELSLQLQHNFQEMVYILDSMEELKVRLLSDDYGKHLLGKFPFPVSTKNIPTAVWRNFLFWFFLNSITGVEDLLQKHSLVEADINVLGERVKQVVQHSQRFLEEEAVEGYQPCDPSIIVDRVSGNYLYFV